MMHQFISWCSFSLKGRLFVKIICVRRTPLNDRKDCDLVSTQCWSVLIATITTGLGIYYVWTLFVSGFGLYANFVDLKSELQRFILVCALTDH